MNKLGRLLLMLFATRVLHLLQPDAPVWQVAVCLVLGMVFIMWGGNDD